MGICNLIGWLVMGAIAGWLASIIMQTNRKQGLVLDIVVGIIGAVIGGFVLSLVGINAEATGLNIGSIVVSFVGAVVLLGLVRLIAR